VSLSPLTVKMAWRNVQRNSRRSLLTILAIGFGLFCLIVFQALKVGLHEEMVRSTVRIDSGTVQIHTAGYQANLANLQPFKDPSTILRIVTEQTDVPLAMRLKVPAMVVAGARSSMVLAAGVQPAAEAHLTLVPQSLNDGEYRVGDENIVIGQTLADSLGIVVGDQLNLLSRTLFGQTVSRAFRVAGMFHTGLTSFDQSQIFLGLEALQTFLNASEIISEMALLTPPDQAAAEAEQLRQALSGLPVQVQSWQEFNPDLVQLIDLNDATMQLLILIVFAIVALGIANTMTMAVFERFRELGIMLAMGQRPRGIVTLILCEALFLGLVAGAVGSLAGWAACHYLAAQGLDLSHFTSANRYFAAGHVIRARLLVPDLLLANLVAVMTALLAGLLPAWRASRLQPVEALRFS